MMKPIVVPTPDNTRAVIRQKQEDRVMQFLESVTISMTAADIRFKCPDIPRMWAGQYMTTRHVSTIMRRLENKGLVISVLCFGRRYYSIPI